MADWIDVAPAEALSEDEPLAATAGGKPIALFKLADGVFALHDLCSHGQARLSDGFVEGETVECPLHQGLICIRTGAARSAPVIEPVAAFPARIADGRVQVLL
jgi:nitrite reductase/ring-hydroxylating ferredoxin subunit